MNARRLTLAAMASLCAVVGFFALSGAPASALLTHPYKCQITAGSIPSATECNGIGNTVPGGAFGAPQGVAVDGAGRVYVSDGAQKVLDVFDSLGNFTSQITGTAPGSPFTTPEGVALEGANNVWVADVGPGRMDKFDSSGSFLAQGTGAGHWTGTNTESVAFSDLSKHLYVADSNRDDLWVLNADGSFNADISGSNATWGTGCCYIRVAADNSGGAANGDLYVSSSQTVTRIDGAGSPASFSGSASYISGAKLTGTPAGAFSHTASVAVDSAGNVYVLDSGRGVVDEFDSTGLFLGQTSGVGTPSGSFGGPQAVAVNAAGDVYVADHGSPAVVDVFGPNVVVPDVTTGAASSVTKTSATLEGVVNPDGTSVTGCEFEYRTAAEATFTHAVACSQPLPMTGTNPVAVSANATGLTVGTTYHYRLAARNANGTNIGSVETFVTQLAVDALSTGLAEAVTPTGATLTGALSPDGTDAHYYFQYGTDTSYGSVSPALPGTDAGTASESVHAETALSGLSANTTYHYRLVGVNAFGTTYGEDATFLTSGPPAIGVESCTGVGSAHLTLNARIDPDGFATRYRFEYGTTPAYGTSAPVPDGEIPSGFSEQPVSVNVTGLQLSTTYHFRVVATNGGGAPVDGADQTCATLPAAVIDSTYATNVASSSADLRAQINSFGNAGTEYHFQYGTTATYGTTIPIPDQELPLSEEDQTVSQHIQNLAPSTTYHYRVVAHNSFGTVDGPDATFTTQQAGTRFALLDGRQWELVSPPNKHGALIERLGWFGIDQAAEDGGAITYHANVPVDLEPQGYALKAQLLSVRGAQGWSTQDISLPHTSMTTGTHGQEYSFFSSDLSLSLAWEGGKDTTLLSDRASEVTPYVRNEALCSSPATASECYLPVVTGKEGFADVPPGAKFAPFSEGYSQPVLGASPDLKHILLEYQVPLTSTPSGGVYEWSADTPPAEALQLISVAPASEGGGPMGVTVGESEGAFPATRHTISDDGSRIFMLDGQKGHGGRPSLYMRDTVKRETVALDVQQPGASSNGSETLWTEFQIASSDGSKVLFTSGEDKNNHNPGRLLTTQSGKSGRDLYECEIVEEAGKLKCDLTDITPETGGHPAEVRNKVSGASEDGSYVYFVANGVLGDGAEHGAKQGSCHNNATVEEAQNVTCNLYLYHGGTTTFIATLSVGDELDWSSESGFGSLGTITARVSPNGRYFTFMSQRSLTGYDNRDANSGKPDTEVFLYDAVGKHLSCVSCNPSGGRPVGIEEQEFSPLHNHQANLVSVVTDLGGGFDTTSWVASNLPAPSRISLTGGLYQQRLLSDSGRVFFNSNDALVPQDVNGQEDVYEFEPPGVGDCTVSSATFDEASGGCLGLVSSGTSPEESGFLDASKSGGDVFFLTTSRLTSQDYDNAFDIYDAHECPVSAPCAAPVVPAPPCSSGDSCKAAPAPQPPIFGAPPSATFTGAGNVTNSSAQGAVGGRTLTRARKLARALKECRGKPKRKRAVCERRARERYGAKGARKSIRKARG